MAGRGLRFAGRSNEFTRASPSVLCLFSFPVGLCCPYSLSDVESLSGNMSNDPLELLACRRDWLGGLVGKLYLAVFLALRHGSLDSGLLWDVPMVRATVSLRGVLLTSGLAVLTLAIVVMLLGQFTIP